MVEQGWVLRTGGQKSDLIYLNVKGKYADGEEEEGKENHRPGLRRGETEHSEIDNGRHYLR
jgi:hypothetical protein